MSGTYPTSPKFNNMSIKSFAPSRVSTAHSQKRQVRFTATHRWIIEGIYPPMTRAEFAPIFAFANKQLGQSGTFQFVLPVDSEALGAGGGTPLVNGASQTGSDVITDGWPNSTVILKAGDYIKFANHAKIYQVTADVTSDGSGNATIGIFPSLMESPAENSAVSYDDLEFTVSFSGDLQETQISQDGYSSFEVEFIEVA